MKARRQPYRQLSIQANRQTDRQSDSRVDITDVYPVTSTAAVVFFFFSIIDICNVAVSNLYQRACVPTYIQRGIVSLSGNGCVIF